MRKVDRSRIVRRSRFGDERWEFYRDPEGRWRWQHLDVDGNIVSLSPHSYRHLLECVTNAKAEGYAQGEGFALRLEQSGQP